LHQLCARGIPAIAWPGGSSSEKHIPDDRECNDEQACAPDQNIANARFGLGLARFLPYQAIDGSRTNGNFWLTIKAPLPELGRPPIRKQGLRNSGFRDVALPRYQA
jgi:hypothetical protein